MKRRRGGPRADTSAWTVHEGGHLARPYGSYRDYTRHQAAKLGTMTPEQLEAHAGRFQDALKRRLTDMSIVEGHESVLCLGAREGAEVRAFIELGCFAVGVDLNPGPGNRYVLTGDFHGTVFPASSVDVVYTNALDHVFDLAKVMAEAHRILRYTGYLVVEATTKRPGEYESFSWESVNALAASIEANGFVLMDRTGIEVPWPGELLLFEPKKRETLSEAAA